MSHDLLVARATESLRVLLVVALATVLAPSLAWAQTPVPDDRALSTLVVDLVRASDDAPIDRATVVVSPADAPGDAVGGPWPRRKTTRASGRAIFAGLPPGRYTITTWSERTDTQAFAATLSPGTGVRAELSLTEVVQMEDVAVVADRLQPELESNGFYRRSRTVRGRQYDRAAFLEPDPRQLSNFLDWAPKVRLKRGPDGLRVVTDGFRSCDYGIWVDGILVQSSQQDGPPFDLDALRVEDIAGVEVYDKRSEVPPQYRDGRCGVILVWTTTHSTLP